MVLPSLRLAAATACAGLAFACGSDSPQAESAVAPVTTAVASDDDVRLVSAAEAAVMLADPANGQVVLDVRTPEEYATGHLEGAELLDFYRDDFADQLGTLDRDVPYVIYCRSGNRSGQTRALMADLGFADVADVDGGIMSWIGEGLPVVTG